MKKRKDECLFCTSRRCSYRIVTEDMSYDEVACSKHIDLLNKHSDDKLPKVMKWFISGTGYYKRGEKFNGSEV